MTEETQPATSTLDAARVHARLQAAAATGQTVTIPSTAAGDDVIWDEVIAGGNYASKALPRGSVLRISDVEGDACVQLVVFDATNPAERLNVADTVKVQWQAYLGPEALLLSDMGRVLLTIVDDTSGRHDALCGGSTAASNATKYGDGSASGPAPSARDLLCLGGAKFGLGRADVGPCISLFKGAPVSDDGSVSFDGDAKPGAYVELRAEVPVIVALANAPHPLDGRAIYTVTPAHVTARRGTPSTSDDRFRTTSPERERAFLNTDEHLRTAYA